MPKSLTENLKYNYLSVDEPPVRDERIGGCIAYCGSCSGLQDDFKSGCAQALNRKFSQSSGCQLMLAMGIINTLTNVLTIVHSPLGCCSNLAGMAGVRNISRSSRGLATEDQTFIHTNMDELDVVNGGIDKLRRAILYADKEYHPEVIAIVNGCVPGIIGDDIDSLARELQTEVSARIVPIHCEGFKSRFVSSGYDAANHGILKYLIREPKEDLKPTKKEQYLNSKTVNIFNVGSNSYGDELELSRLVKALGLIPRVVPLHASVDDLDRLGEAALNVSICATHDDYLLGHLKERYGTEYILDVLPIGIRCTNIWLGKIAAHFNLEEEAEELIRQENRELKEAIEPFVEVLKGKKIFVGGGETRILTTADFYRSIGMEVVGVKSHNVDRFVENLLDEIDDPNLLVEVAAGQPAEELNTLSRLKPDIYIGHIGANGWVTKLGIPNIPLFGTNINYMGYSGAFELARRAARALKNTNFSKNISRHVELPLTEEWMRLNPKENIIQGALF
ncbi:nitrogenase component 1 [Herbinix luporum]|uniref:nitrogenase component 1 n=1 Tax=Herbinix luporum TaxID=1679721 RepID=UPI0023F112FB|nr:nitrogenase component 1 [Herbinix luporum]